MPVRMQHDGPRRRRSPGSPADVTRPARIAAGLAARWLGCLALLSSVTTGITMHAAAEERETSSVDVVFVLDNSGSMRENDPAFLTRKAVSDFAATLERDEAIEARIAVVLFDEQAELALPLTSTGDPLASTRLTEALAALDFSGQRTHGPAGVERALYELRERARTDARKAIVFLSDGKIDTGDRQGDLDAGRWLREDLAVESGREGIQIFAIAFTEAADFPLMQSLARRTGAQYYRAFEATELSNVVDRILERLGTDEAYALATLDATRHAEPESPPGGDATNRGISSSTPPVASAPLVDPIGASPRSPAASAGMGHKPLREGSDATVEHREPFGLIGLLPIALLLVAGSLYWRRRLSAEQALAPSAIPRVPGPPAQLLDFGGQIGESGTSLALRPYRTTIGRDPHNDIVLPDETISSEHAVIEFRDGRYWLEDARSTNGTRHGDQRLGSDRRVALKGGDHIRFAEIDLMFVLAGYVPGGATVYLTSSTGPPEGWLAQSWANDIPDGDASSQGEASSHGEASSAIVDLDAELATADREARSKSLFRDCLDYHLARVAEISSDFDAFVASAFDEELREAIGVTAEELVTRDRNEGAMAQREYTSSRIRYLILGLPSAMDDASAYFVESHGGFTRLLSEQLQSDSFSQDGCEILAVLTFGMGEEPWVSLTIVPEAGRAPRLDLLSYEFLTPEERREIEPTIDSEISQAGLR